MNLWESVDMGRWLLVQRQRRWRCLSTNRVRVGTWHYKCNFRIFKGDRNLWAFHVRCGAASGTSGWSKNLQEERGQSIMTVFCNPWKKYGYARVDLDINVYPSISCFFYFPSSIQCVVLSSLFPLLFAEKTNREPGFRAQLLCPWNEIGSKYS